MKIKPVIVNGIKIYPFKNFDNLIKETISLKTILIATNARKIINNDLRLKKIINDNVAYVDGVGAQVAIKKKVNKSAPKIPGCELWLEIIKKYNKEKSFFFIGASEKVINKTIKRLKNNFPEMNIKGYRNGFFTNEHEKHSIFRELKQKKPNIIFVAMGSPTQEFFMQECFDNYPALYQGLGGSFDVYVGNKNRPPKLFIKLRLEGLFIAISEGIKNPKQRFYRVLNTTKMFVYLYLKKI
jgi:UDP-N-acetyl-D-mannosaminouronate:lipid I N-acetyl-D-mannosaminouronosyltransferase